MIKSCRKCRHYKGEEVSYVMLYVYPTYQGAVKAPFYTLECNVFGVPFGGCEENLHEKVAEHCPFYEESGSHES